MKVIQEKINALKSLTSDRDIFIKAVKFLEGREAAGKKEAASEGFAVWDSTGNTRVNLSASKVFRADELIQLLQRRILECDEAIAKIQPVLDMAERVFKAEETAA